MKNMQRAISAVTLSSLATTLVACNAAPQFAPGPQFAQRNIQAQNFRRANAGSPNAQKIDQAVARGLDHVPGEFLVKLRPGAGAAALSQSMGTLNAQMEPVGNAQSGIVLVKTAGASAAATGQTLQALKSNPAVLYAEPNFIVKLDIPQTPAEVDEKPPTDTAPNDPLYKRQYHHENMQSEAGWAVGQGNEDFILSIVDTGVDYSHPDLKAKLLPGYDTVDGKPEVTDGNGHGTHCAGIAAAITNNGVGVAGVAPNVKILPIKVLSDSGSGSYKSVSDGIIKAADMGAKVISMSLGGPSNSAILADAVKYAQDKGAILVAAMGNGYHGDSANPRPRKSYPAAVDGVFAVGATDKKDKIARFSQAGEWINVTAPGVNILATFPTHKSSMPGKDYGAISGTSMATPAVSGLAALVWSQYPEMTAQQVEAHIEATSDDLGPDGTDILFGAGRINVGRAMNTAPGGGNNAMMALRTRRAPINTMRVARNFR